MTVSADIKTECSVPFIRTVESAEVFITHALSADMIAIDTETTGITGIKDGRDYAIGVSLAFRIEPLGILTCYFPLRHIQDNLPLRAMLPRLQLVLRSVPLVFHNRKFDLHSLASLGLDVNDFHSQQYDTMMETQLVNEEWYSKSLDSLSKMLFNEAKAPHLALFANTFGWAETPPNLMGPYAQRDAELTLKLHELLWPKLEEQELTHLWPVESSFIKALFDMERIGLGINADFCNQKVKQGTQRMAAIKDELGFNPSSHLDLRKFFFEDLELPVLQRSEKGDNKPSLNKKVLEEYDILLQATNTTSARLVLEFRGWQKAVSSLYDPILRLVSPDGRIRTNFNQHGTVTGRLSSNGPNLQQIPRTSGHVWNGDAKRAFCPGSGYEDYELIGYDYSQLELRLATAYGGDKWLRDIFNADERDVFTEMSERLNVDRYVAKTQTYGTLYGAGLEKIAATLGKSVGDTEGPYREFIESISGIKSAATRATRLAKQRGYVRYWTGRRRHFRDRDGDSFKAFNSILQGGAAELVKRAQLRCRDLESDDAKIVLQVHDELVWLIRKGTRHIIEPEIIKQMTSWTEFGVKLTVSQPTKTWNGNVLCT